jgi:hypothetical protein
MKFSPFSSCFLLLNFFRGEIIRTKFSPLFKFVDEKYQIIAVSSNDCGGSGKFGWLFLALGNK